MTARKDVAIPPAAAEGAVWAAEAVFPGVKRAFPDVQKLTGKKDPGRGLAFVEPASVDGTDAWKAVVGVLAKKYSLQEAEQLFVQRPRVVWYGTCEQLSRKEDLGELKRLCEEQAALAADEKAIDSGPATNVAKVGWVLGEIPQDDYEQRRLVSLYLGAMRDFVFTFRLIVGDLRSKAGAWESDPYAHLPPEQQLDEWHASVGAAGALRSDASKDVRDHYAKANYALFQKAPGASLTTNVVLLRGDSGTGKTLIARLLHKELFPDEAVPHPFQSVLCPGLSKALLESELFGAMKGSFTDRSTTSAGLILNAYNGVLFLDEIADIGLDIQAKLLKFLDDSVVRPLGWNLPGGIRVPVVIVAATNAPLEERVAAGTFRADLLYRLQRYELRIPSLNERLRDLEGLVDFVLQNPEINRRSEEKSDFFVTHVETAVLDALRKKTWPGNFRQLESVLQKAVFRARLSGTRLLRLIHFNFESAGAAK